MISALLLILDVVIGLGAAVLLAVGVLAWFVTWWFVLPVWSRIRHQPRTDLIDALDKDLTPDHRADSPPCRRPLPGAGHDSASRGCQARKTGRRRTANVSRDACNVTRV